MGVIYSYPQKGSLVADDLFVITDPADSNKTKTVTAQIVADYIDGEVTLQEVLDASDPGVTPPTAGAIGNITLKGNIQLSANTSDFILDGGKLTATAGNNTRIEGPQNVSVSPTLDFTVSTDTDILHNSRDYIGDFVRDYRVGADNTIEMHTTGASPVTTAGEIAILANQDLNLLSNAVINIGQSGTGQPESIFFNTSGPGAPGNAITFFVATSGNDIEFPNNAYLKLLGAVKDSTSAVAPGADHFLSSDGTGKVVWKDEAEITPSKLVEEVQFQNPVVKGTAVYISGPAHGSGRPTVDIADSTKSNGDFPVVGIANDTYPAGAGEVIVTGILDDFDVTTIVGAGVGDTLYLDPSATTVNLTATKPTLSTNVIQNVAIVTKAGANGQLQVNAIGRVNDLPNNDVNALFTADASGYPVTTNGVLNVDAATNQTTLGFGARYNTTAGTGTGLGSGNANIQFGREAMAQVYGAGVHTGSGLNLAIGNEAMMGNVGVGAVCSSNTAIGWQAMKLQDMSNALLNNNVAIGSGALRGAALSATGLGGDNVAIGALALDSTNATSARRNVAIGSNALTNQTTAESNIAVGYSSGLTVNTGQDNVLVGSAADLTADHSGSTGVGRNVRVAEGALALGHNANANISGSIALGAGAVATNPTINLTVAGAPAPAGGLPQHPDNATAMAAGLLDGDVYVIPVPGGTPGFGAGAHVMAIVHP